MKQPGPDADQEEEIVRQDEPDRVIRKMFIIRAGHFTIRCAALSSFFNIGFGL